MVAKDVLLSPETTYNIVLEQWAAQLSCFGYKLQSLQLDMAEFACVNAIMLFEQGKGRFTNEGHFDGCAIVERTTGVWGRGWYHC